ncbi:hypothetical protein ES288_D05G396300v1 [Gossypium darwinii]|uniref:Uncharacterized protein n=1 Tax=Gossypium darwinii TaxID=34276 RepID=A0A5D2CRU7_GOSDA|nr:hypothetical protein ES288_D05G396300v1 [Gossypium darwinii]
MLSTLWDSLGYHKILRASEYNQISPSLVSSWLFLLTLPCSQFHISNPPKPKPFIICATPGRPRTSTGSGGKINSIVGNSEKSKVGVKEVNHPHTTILNDVNEENEHKSQANVNGDNDDGAVKGTELPTD